MNPYLTVYKPVDHGYGDDVNIKKDEVISAMNDEKQITQYKEAQRNKPLEYIRCISDVKESLNILEQEINDQYKKLPFDGVRGKFLAGISNIKEIILLDNRYPIVQQKAASQKIQIDESITRHNRRLLRKIPKDFSWMVLKYAILVLGMFERTSHEPIDQTEVVQLQKNIAEKKTSIENEEKKTSTKNEENNAGGKKRRSRKKRTNKKNKSKKRKSRSKTRK